VVIYDYKSNVEKRSLSKFKDVVYSGRYRWDGKLLATGGARGVVQVTDVATRTALRQFKGHRGPVHFASFTPSGVQLVSAGDDRSIR
jgi:U3 small nucleolar RNA-associated protein 15